MVSGEKLTTATGEDSPFELNLSFRPSGRLIATGASPLLDPLQYIFLQ